jgi:succinoglycan biosynthesis protein ExoM
MQSSQTLPVAVCVCTYQRPLQLSRLLDSLANIARPSSTSFIVVDNDGSDAEIEERVAQFRNRSRARVEYVVERTAGIAAARNTAVASACAMGAKTIAMLDDDEWAPPEWLSELIKVRDVSGAAVVGGPVRPVFEAGTSDIEGYESLWSIGKGSRDGRVFVSCTCNCLIETSATSALGNDPFPTNFGLTGGEDAVFFRRLHNAGVKMEWAENAVLFEAVPRVRARFSWMRQRWYRQGNVGVACERIARSPGEIPPLLKTLLLFGRLPFYPMFNRAALRLPRIWQLEWAKLRGRVAAHAGMVFQEYARSATSSSDD